MLNTAVAESFDEIATALEKLPRGADFHAELQKLLSSIIKKHKRVIFNGNSYSDEWKKEAQRRGLPNLRTTPEAIEPLVKKENIALFEKYGVFNAVELKSRHEVFLEEYQRKIEIEAGLSLKLARTHIIPAGVAYLEKLGKGLEVVRAVSKKKSKLAECAANVAERVDSLVAAADALEAKIAKGDYPAIIAAMGELRKIADKLEGEVDNDLWQMPKYCEMLFVY